MSQIKAAGIGETNLWSVFLEVWRTNEPSQTVDHEPGPGSISSHPARNGKCVSCLGPEAGLAGIGASVPAISVAETNDAFEVTAELAGVAERDIKVSLDDNQLVISGRRSAELRPGTDDTEQGRLAPGR